MAKEHLENVEIIEGLPDDPRLAVDSFDAAIIVNAYHEMPSHTAILVHVRSALKKTGHLILMERVADSLESLSRDELVKKHQLTIQIGKRELEAAGFEIIEVRDPFFERPPDSNGKSRWWIIDARRRQ